jgi:signal transduction histidine kinase
MAVINHDLRTPLASVLTVLESLGQGVYGKLEEQDLQIVGQSDEELKALLLQINDLLTLEKIDAGSYDMTMQDLTVSEILTASKNSVKEESEEKNVTISVSSTPDVSNTVLRGDRDLLVRLCAIVLKNAIENSNKGSSLNLRLEKSGSTIKMNIEDCGRGINPDLLPIIFQRFRFIDGKPIAGLGLALAFRVCKMHEGEISIEKTSPTGTTVGITLPATPGTAAFQAV